MKATKRELQQEDIINNLEEQKKTLEILVRVLFIICEKEIPGFKEKQNKKYV